MTNLTKEILGIMSDKKWYSTVQLTILIKNSSIKPETAWRNSDKRSTFTDIEKRLHSGRRKIVQRCLQQLYYKLIIDRRYKNGRYRNELAEWKIKEQL